MGEGTAASALIAFPGDEHDRVLVQQTARQTPGPAGALLGVELVDRVEDAVEPGAHTLQHDLARERGRKVRLACARTSTMLRAVVRYSPV